MQKSVQRLMALIVLGVAVLVLPSVALAIPQFQKAWQEKYLTEGTDEAFQELIKKEAKCWVCHQGKTKKHHNEYGKHFLPLLEKTDKDDTDKINKALADVGAMHSIAGDEESPTYAELIAKGKLPGGELEELKKEPEGEESEE